MGVVLAALLGTVMLAATPAPATAPPSTLDARPWLHKTTGAQWDVNYFVVGLLKDPRDDDEFALKCLALDYAARHPRCDEIAKRDAALSPMTLLAVWDHRMGLAASLIPRGEPLAARDYRISNLLWAQAHTLLLHRVFYHRLTVVPLDARGHLRGAWAALMWRWARDSRLPVGLRYLLVCETLPGASHGKGTRDLDILLEGTELSREEFFRPSGPTPAAPQAIRDMSDPFRGSGGFGGQPVAFKREVVDVLFELRAAEELAQIMMRPEFVPEKELRAYAKEKLDSILADPRFGRAAAPDISRD